MQHHYTPEQLRNALHTASLARAGLNISSFFLNREEWTEAHIVDLQEILKALPEQHEEVWLPTHPTVLFVGDTYRVRADDWEVVATVQPSQAPYTQGWTPDTPPVSPQATAMYHPLTGERYMFADVLLHATMVLEQREQVLPLTTVQEACDIFVELLQQDMHPAHMRAFLQRGDLPIHVHGDQIVLNVRVIQKFMKARKAGKAILQEALHGKDTPFEDIVS